MGSITAVLLCTPSDPSLMNARWLYSSPLIHGCTSYLILGTYYTVQLPTGFFPSELQFDLESPLSLSDTMHHLPHLTAQAHGATRTLPFIHHLLQRVSSHDQQYSSPNLLRSLLYQQFDGSSSQKQNPRSSMVKVSLLSHLSTGNGDPILTLYPDAHSYIPTRILPTANCAYSVLSTKRPE